MESLAEGESAFDTESLRWRRPRSRCIRRRGGAHPAGGEQRSRLRLHYSRAACLHALRARINGKIRQLKARLLDGDQVAIETVEQTVVLPNGWSGPLPPAPQQHPPLLRNRVQQPATENRRLMFNAEVRLLF